jgi:hypothetical protein
MTTAYIPKGTVGEVSKIKEEFLDFEAAVGQKNPILALSELASLYGAIKAFLKSKHPTITMEHLEVMQAADSVKPAPVPPPDCGDTI